MSSWGPRSFEDDFACDWLEDLHESDAFSFFAHCLDLSDQEELNFLACIGVRCTCEILVAVIDEPRPGMPEKALRWTQENSTLATELKALMPHCLESIDRVLLSGSAMQLKWHDAGPVHYEIWCDEMSDLRQRLVELNSQLASD